jgi:uncharacterized membrane protein YkgB
VPLPITNRQRARLDRGSIALLRASLGLVFLCFGVLKFVPGLSPAESLAERTVEALTLGLTPDGAAIYLVAALESAIGLSLLTGRLVRVGLALLAVAMGGILAPIVLFPAEMFAPHAYLPLYGPTLAGQYVLKDVVLLAAALVVAVRALLGAPSARVPDLAAAAPAALASAARPTPRRHPELAA